MVKLPKIRKRDGSIVKFEQQKITDAIQKALVAVELKDGTTAKKISDEVVKILEKNFVKKIPSVEDIQNIVIEVLRKRGYKKVADDYSAYRKKKLKSENLRKSSG